MPFQDFISHTAAVAKWKTDQQIRLLKSQSRISEIENQIKVEKSVLADNTLALYAQEKLVEDELKQICANIEALHEQIKEQQKLQEAARNEHPPQQTTYTADYPPIPVENNKIKENVIPQENSILMTCPKCGKSLSVRFCPEHGIEGVLRQKTSQGE